MMIRAFFDGTGISYITDIGGIVDINIYGLKSEVPLTLMAIRPRAGVGE